MQSGTRPSRFQCGPQLVGKLDRCHNIVLRMVQASGEGRNNLNRLGRKVLAFVAVGKGPIVAHAIRFEFEPRGKGCEARNRAIPPGTSMLGGAEGYILCKIAALAVAHHENFVRVVHRGIAIDHSEDMFHVLHIQGIPQITWIGIVVMHHSSIAEHPATRCGSQADENDLSFLCPLHPPPVAAGALHRVLTFNDDHYWHCLQGSCAPRRLEPRKASLDPSNSKLVNISCAVTDTRRNIPNANPLQTFR
mmetsp:Transcript_18404/g.44379  ORF Transcript_18404/g.44379 Transcript_18404/m.44379 type:complete len:248 (+) Transcript_18404:217-960(+)